MLRENRSKYGAAPLFWPDDPMAILDAAKPTKWKSCKSMAPNYSKSDLAPTNQTSPSERGMLHSS